MTNAGLRCVGAIGKPGERECCLWCLLREDRKGIRAELSLHCDILQLLTELDESGALCANRIDYVTASGRATAPLFAPLLCGSGSLD